MNTNGPKFEGEVGNNSGQRLLRLCERLKSCQQDAAALRGWQDILQCVGVDPRRIIPAILAVYELPSEVASATMLLSLPSDPYLLWQNAIRAGLKTHNFEQKISAFSNPISSEAMGLLKVCAHQLSERSPEPILPEDAQRQLSGLIVEVNKLRAEVQLLDPRLRAFASMHLGAIEDAWIYYQINGIHAIGRSIATCAGSFTPWPNEVKDLRKSGLGRKVLELIGNLVLVAEAAEYTHAAFEGLKQLLLE